MSIHDNRSAGAMTGPRSRRAALHAGGLLFAGMGALALQRGAAAQATPAAGAPGNGLLLVQSFSQGSLFPTQGDGGVLPYTVILWDAADRGFFFADWASGGAGVVSTERVLDAIGVGGAPLRALLVGPAAENGSSPPGEMAWALSLVAGSLGSDPGAVTYQGEPLAGADAAAWLGAAPADLPEGPQILGPGFFILTGPSGFDASVGDGVRLNVT